ncbi:FMN reductase [Acinetobacter sp. MB5]|uniref:FMN reductase n=1 Tax=Acinetobacter sp. MB5 TaxID=2069438 RepID=UPI000DD064E4|nr:FMN reductase [Acinetobacter sp. MB5]
MFKKNQILKIVVVSGGLGAMSKTEKLVTTIAEEISKHVAVDLQIVKFSEIGRFVGQAMYRNELPEQVEASLQAIENADALIIGTPVYRASFSGLFKHFFDFVEQYSLVNVPVFLAATGGSEKHALVIEHQLRPLFSFFQTYTLPLGIYATDKDFNSDYEINSMELLNRISLAVSRALPILQNLSQPLAEISTNNIQRTVVPSSCASIL